jgi:N-acetylneuraminic acid mutarotase
MKSPLLKLTASFVIFFLLFSCNDSEQISPSPVKGSLLAIKRGDLAPKGYELFKLSEPRDLAWEESASLSEGRRSADAVVSIGGKIYFASGNTHEEFDPVTNTWTKLALMTEPRGGATATVFDNRYYVMGGHNGTITMITNEVFDPSSGQWSRIADLPHHTRAAASITVDGKIYFVGGVSSGVTGEVQTDNNLMYDPNEDVWYKKQKMLFPRESMKLVWFENKIWAIGGWWAGGPSEHVHSYDPSNDKWNEEASLNLKRLSPCVWLADGKIHVSGGSTGVLNDEVYYDFIEAYNPLERVWEKVGQFPEKLGHSDAVVMGDKVYVVGGQNEKGPSSKVFTADISPPLDLYFYK